MTLLKCLIISCILILADTQQSNYYDSKPLSLYDYFGSGSYWWSQQPNNSGDQRRLTPPPQYMLEEATQSTKVQIRSTTAPSIENRIKPTSNIPSKITNPQSDDYDYTLNEGVTQGNLKRPETDSDTLNDVRVMQEYINRITRPKSSEVQAGIVDFGFNLLKNLEGSPGKNIVVSPFSIATLLSVLQQGASGATEQQIKDALHITSDVAASAYRHFNEDNKKRKTNNILDVASSLYVSKTFEIDPAFKTSAINNFGCQVTTENFKKPRQTAMHINDWVSNQTHSKIKQIVQQDAIDPETQLILVNAIYFKGLWRFKFKPEATRTADFHLSNGEVKPVTFMYKRIAHFQSGYDIDTLDRFVIVPFEFDEFALIIIVPDKKSSVSMTLSKLTNAKLLEFYRSRINEVELYLPKFNIKTDTDLKPVLWKMGLSNLFDKAELSGIGGQGMPSPQVSTAVHSAMLSIDETGGSAAGATAFGAVPLSYDGPPKVIRPDRPFIAVLWDVQLSLPLFVAKIEDPSVQ